MKTDLEILIEHVQSEADALKSQLDLCIADHDFEGAHVLKKAWLHTNRRLSILKSVQNPNQKRMAMLSRRIDMLKDDILSRNSFRLDIDDGVAMPGAICQDTCLLGRLITKRLQRDRIGHGN